MLNISVWYWKYKTNPKIPDLSSPNSNNIKRKIQWPLFFLPPTLPSLSQHVLLIISCLVSCCWCCLFRLWFLLTHEVQLVITLSVWVWGHPLEKRPYPPKRLILPSPIAINFHELLCKEWGLKIIYPMYVKILVALILCR